MINISLDNMDSHKTERLLPEQMYSGSTNINSNELSAIEKLTQMGREATKLSFDDLPLSPDCDSGLSDFPDDLLNEITQYDLNTYYSNNLQKHTHFFKKIPIDEIMRWSSEQLSKPLTKLPSNLVDFALQLFKNLQSYMGDRKSTKQPISHIKKHLKFTINSSQELKDEGYLQVIKQITLHPEYDKCLRGWKFLAIMAASFAPSMELYYSLLNFIKNEINTTSDENIKKHGNYVFIRLVKSFENKRKQIPSDEEIMHIEHMKPIMFPVYFLSNNHLLIPTESYTTVKDLKTSIMRKIQFNVARIPYYCLYEICNKKDYIEERFLEDSDKIVDIVAMWDKEKDEYMKTNELIEFKIYLKIQLFYNYIESDIDTITMMYVQTMYDVISGRFNLKDNDIITLASLQLLNNFPEKDERAIENLKKNLENYIPLNILTQSNSSKWVPKILEIYSGLNLSSKLETKLTYLEHCKQSHLWESHQFFVKYSNKLNTGVSEKLYPDNCIIAIKPKGLSILDQDRNELEFNPYNIIASWGVSSSIFVIVISKTEGDLNKYYFESNQTKFIQYLLESYTNLIVGKSIKETMLSAVASSKKFDNLVKEKKNYDQKNQKSFRSRISTIYSKK